MRSKPLRGDSATRRSEALPQHVSDIQDFPASGIGWSPFDLKTGTPTIALSQKESRQHLVDSSSFHRPDRASLLTRRHQLCIQSVKSETGVSPVSRLEKLYASRIFHSLIHINHQLVSLASETDITQRGDTDHPWHQHSHSWVFRDVPANPVFFSFRYRPSCTGHVASWAVRQAPGLR